MIRPMLLGDYIDQVNKELKSLLVTKQKSTKHPEIKDLIKQQSSIISSGKRLRPLVFFIGYSSYGGNVNPAIIDLGVALELLHQALLVHDDLIDQDNFRRGVKNVIGIRQTDNQAAAASGLLIGDLLLSYCFETLTNIRSLEDKTKLSITRLFNKHLELTITGQELDALNTRDFRVNLKRLNQINELKTSSYSTRLPVSIVSQLISLDKTEANQLDKFASALGQLLQLVNDLDDYFGSSARLSDFMNGRITLPYLKLLDSAAHVHKHYLNERFGKRLTASEQKQVVSVARRTLTKDKVNQIVRAYYKKAVNELNKLSLNSRGHDQFMDIIDDLKSQAV